MNFEEKMKRLDEITEKLEQKGLPLEEAVALYQEGLVLLKECNQKLEDAASLMENSSELP